MHLYSHAGRPLGAVRGWNVDAPAGGKRPKWFGPTFTAKYTPQAPPFFRRRRDGCWQCWVHGFKSKTREDEGPALGDPILDSGVGMIVTLSQMLVCLGLAWLGLFCLID